MTSDLRLPRVLHALIHLSLRERVMSSAEIATMLSINAVVVRRMLAGLRETGLIEATKGRSGGWRVVRSLDSISVADVFEALDRPGWSAPSESRDHPGCPVEGAVNSTLTDIEAEAARQVLARYESLSLGDIARMATDTK
ncbi:Rrf2 family transcriptional regulator [Qingshengfaniella alkalisoli]|uniref:Rrf2 family transcriptional regulator n=1 Tax=Qingshengfaniella alkalisoli TaxID=2599296 RepID=A0A5B8IT36_9RHOB|nr:Rrf2 family transcriptional regulator [Qingshengfaniella alkalisoli]QDY69412.1 Rrf2 family transcriptional regulator [Qingshengfaniella alkalisoli]